MTSRPPKHDVAGGGDDDPGHVLDLPGRDREHEVAAGQRVGGNVGDDGAGVVRCRKPGVAFDPALQVDDVVQRQPVAGGAYGGRAVRQPASRVSVAPFDAGDSVEDAVEVVLGDAVASAMPAS